MLRSNKENPSRRDPSRFVELHSHSYYSLLDASSSPEALVQRAATLGMPALALTDHDTLAGAMRFYVAAQQAGIKPILGAEVTLWDEAHADTHLTLIAETQEGYANLCQLLTRARCAPLPPSANVVSPVELHTTTHAQPLPSPARRGAGGEVWLGKTPARVTLDQLSAHHAGLIALTGCRKGWLAQSILRSNLPNAIKHAQLLSDLFGPHHCYVELQHHHQPDDHRLVRGLVEVARALRLPIVATGNTHYAMSDHAPLRDCLIAIDHNLTLTQARRQQLLPPNHTYALPSAQSMARHFGEWPQSLANTLAIAERCWVNLDFSGYKLPPFPVPEGHTEFSYVYELCHRALPKRYPQLSPNVLKQLAHELDVIHRTGLSGFFLMCWDIVTYARSIGVRCQGRGSAAGSITSYCLGISNVEPLSNGLLFERFLSEDRLTLPDIDIDFGEGRDRVIAWLYQRYGTAASNTIPHTAMVANHVTYKAKSAIRELGKVLGFSEAVIERLGKHIDTYDPLIAADQIESLIPNPPPHPLTPSSPHTHHPRHPLKTLASLMRQINGLVRHLSIHSGGIIVAGERLDRMVPVQPATMPGRYVVEWDKDSIEDAGLAKCDILSVKFLGVLNEAVQHIAQRTGQSINLDDLPTNDPAVYAMLQRGDAIGVFQLESRSNLQMLVRLKPRDLNDLAVQIALIRPGPIQGGAVHPYLRRRAGEELSTPLHPLLEPVLRQTHQVILFQEDVLRVAMTIANFTAGEADQLRRAMSRTRSEAAMQAMHERFMAGAHSNAVSAEDAEQIWNRLSGFAQYGFLRSHAASFALIAYQSAWLKAHYPAQLYAALLNHQPCGFYPPDILINDARQHHIQFLPADINHSQWGYTPLSRQNGRGVASDARGEGQARGERPSLRIGLQVVAGLGQTHWQQIAAARAERPFTSLQDFCARVRFPKSLTQDLIRAGLFDSLGERRPLLWALGEIHGDANPNQPDDLGLEIPLSQIALPSLSEVEAAMWDYELTGTSPSGQFMQHFRPALQRAGVLTAAQVVAQPPGKRVRVAGMVVVKQRPQTAKGMTFIGLTDEHTLLDIAVRPDVYAHHRHIIRDAAILLVEGIVRKQGDATSLLAYAFARGQ